MLNAFQETLLREIVGRKNPTADEIVEHATARGWGVLLRYVPSLTTRWSASIEPPADPPVEPRTSLADDRRTALALALFEAQTAAEGPSGEVPQPAGELTEDEEALLRVLVGARTEETPLWFYLDGNKIDIELWNQDVEPRWWASTNARGQDHVEEAGASRRAALGRLIIAVNTRIPGPGSEKNR